ncbi:MAG: hypothetical protein AAF211_21590 [Myxococcota bacterium]
MNVWFLLLGCTSNMGVGIGYEFVGVLDVDTTFVATATSRVPQRDASDVTLGMRVEFADERPREPFEIDVTVGGRTETVVSDPASLSLHAAADVDLFPCDDRECREDVTFEVRPDFDGPRDVRIAVDLEVVGITGDYQPDCCVTLEVDSDFAIRNPR